MEGPGQQREIWPGFHFLRHLLAIVILGFHAYVLTFGGAGNIGYVKGDLMTTASQLTTKQLVIEGLRPGLFALVGMFFALSGFLVMGSALRARDIRSFFTLRVLRILPALLTEVMLSAFVLGPLVTTRGAASYFGDTSTFTYFGNIVGLIQYELPGVFTANPVPDIVNVNLWTLHAEFACYLMMAVVMASGLIRRVGPLTIVILAGVAIVALLAALPGIGLTTRFAATHFQSWFLVLLFALGMLFALHRHTIPLRVDLFVAASLGYALLMITGLCDTLAAVLLTYTTVFLGSCRFGWFDRLVKDDCSYGIYLYGYPITQTLVFAIGARLQGWPSPARLAVFVVGTIAITACFALLSWRVIEKPFLGLRSILLPGRPTMPAAPAAGDVPAPARAA